MKKPTKKPFPKPPKLRKIIGPSFIILALGLGSGEVILWPYLASNYGLGIVWGAVLGITFQFFINMEIERYALIKGESVFVGINSKVRWAAYWFIASTFIGFGLPGIIAASAKVFSHVVGIAEFKWVAIAFLILIGIVLSSGKTVYGLMEKLTKTIILIGVPFVFILAIYISTKVDWITLARGLAGHGEGYMFLPAGISIATFLAAFAYSGAGGNLNLTQSIYVKEKGYGMGKYAQKIAGLFVKKSTKQEISLTGPTCDFTDKSFSRFVGWWRLVNLEHLVVFWFIGAVSMLLLMLLAYATTFGAAGNEEGINFVINEGAAIGVMTLPAIGIIFLTVVSVMLFQTQLGVMDSTSRIMAENYALKYSNRNKTSKVHLSKIYFSFLWAQIAFGIILFLLNIHEPKTLIVLGAVINAFAMTVHIALVFYLNNTSLPKKYRPKIYRKLTLAIIFLFFAGFSLLVLWDKLSVYFT